MDAALIILQQEMADSGDCNVPATVWTGLTGSGTDIVSGQMLKNGSQEGVRIMINAVQVQHSPTFTTPCADGPVSATLPLNFSEPYWLQQDFPAGGGSRQVKIELFDKGVEKLNGNPGTNAAYEAFLEVRRVR